MKKLKLLQTLQQGDKVNELNNMVAEWRGVAQRACEDLFPKFREAVQSNGGDGGARSITMTMMLTALNIDEKLIGYDVDAESFV